MFASLREANVARQIEWDPNHLLDDIEWWENELAGETGELCNVLKKLHRERFGLPGSRADGEMLADELADVVICLDSLLRVAGHGPSVPSTLGAIPTEAPVAIGVKLFSAVARLFTVLAFDVRIEIEECANGVHSICAGIARMEGISLPTAVAKKFNQTSTKLGFSTMIGVD